MENNNLPYLKLYLPPNFLNNSQKHNLHEFQRIVPLEVLSKTEKISTKPKTIKDVNLIFNHQFELFSYQQDVIEEVYMDYEEAGSENREDLYDQRVLYKISQDIDFEELDVFKFWKSFLIIHDYVSNNLDLLARVGKDNTIILSRYPKEIFGKDDPFFKVLVYDALIQVFDFKKDTLKSILEMMNEQRHFEMGKMRLLFRIFNNAALLFNYFQVSVELNTIFNMNNDEINKTLELSPELEALL